MERVTETRPLHGRGLAGRAIVVTRPEHQARALSELIRDVGGTPLVFPVLEIFDVQDIQPLLAVIARLSSFELAIFISPNAVNKAMNLILARGGMPSTVRVATVGKGSARELRRLGIEHIIAPEEGFDSEALLALPEMWDLAGKRVVIFRGDGGRGLLGDTLIARGAVVEYAECYRRSKPTSDAAVLLGMWARDEVSGVVITSGEGLRNLFDMIGEAGQQRLRATPLFVPHPRIAETARELGVMQVVLTGPGDEGIVRSMIDWWGECSAPRVDC